MSEVQPKAGLRVRSSNDGQVGFLVDVDGKWCVKLDRKQQEIILPYQPGRWLPDESGRLTPYHVATIAYAADRQLKEARGEYGVKEFRQLPEAQRIAWMKGPPKEADAERWQLWHGIRDALAGDRSE